MFSNHNSLIYDLPPFDNSGFASLLSNKASRNSACLFVNFILESNYISDETILDTVIYFQKNAIVNPDKKYPYKLKLSYNYPKKRSGSNYIYTSYT